LARGIDLGQGIPIKLFIGRIRRSLFLDSRFRGDDKGTCRYAPENGSIGLTPTRHSRESGNPGSGGVKEGVFFFLSIALNYLKIMIIFEKHKKQ